MPAVIETRNLSKHFRIGTNEKLTLFSAVRHNLSGEYPKREIWALKDINISVNKGEMVAVIGPNGAGKTTLLKILAGIMNPTSGSYSVKEEVSCMFELGLGFNLRFSALENIYLYGALHGLTRRHMEKKLPEIVEFSGLEEFMGAKLSEFSTGMRARLAFSTVIQTLKGVVMVDEVLAVGDVSFQKKCIKVFENKLNEGNTILFISHGTENIRHICGRALYINCGRQEGFGALDEIQGKYREDIDRINNGKN